MNNIKVHVILLIVLILIVLVDHVYLKNAVVLHVMVEGILYNTNIS